MGSLIFGLVRQDVLRLVIGAIAVAFALNNLFGWARKRPPANASWPRGVSWSAVSGVTSFLAHAGSPPLMAYLLPLRLDKRIYVGTTVWFFFASNYAKIVPYAFLGQLDTTNFATSLISAPGPCGRQARRVHPRQTRGAGVLPDQLLGVAYLGIKLVYDGVSLP